MLTAKQELAQAILGLYNDESKKYGNIGALSSIITLCQKIASGERCNVYRDIYYGISCYVKRYARRKFRFKSDIVATLRRIADEYEKLADEAINNYNNGKINKMGRFIVADDNKTVIDYKQSDRISHTPIEKME